MWRKNYLCIIIIWNILMALSYFSFKFMADESYLTGLKSLWYVVNIIFAYIMVAELLCLQTRRSKPEDIDTSTGGGNVVGYVCLAMGFAKTPESRHGNKR